MPTLLDSDNTVIPGVEDLTEEELEIVIEEAAEMLRREAEQKQSILDKLADFVEQKFMRLHAAKSLKRTEMIRSLELIEGVLAEPHVDGIREVFQNEQVNRTKPYPNIVRSKCNYVKAQLVAGQFATGDKNWSLRPSPRLDTIPNPEVPPIIACKNMEMEILDQLNECRYGYEYRKLIDNYVELGTGVMKGPGNSNSFKKTYMPQQQSDGTLIYIPTIIPVPRPGLWSVDPFYFFPDDSVVDPKDVRVDIEVHVYGGIDFQRLFLKHPGFMPDQIAKALAKGPTRSEISIKEFVPLLGHNLNLRDKYVVKEFHGPVEIQDLLNLGIIDEDHPYGNEVIAELWVCNGVCIRAALPLIEHSDTPPYAIASYEKDPGSLFGFSLPLLLESQQRVVKIAGEMLLDNAAISSGPQVVIDKTKLAPADEGGDYSIRPWKAWLVDEYGEQGVDHSIKFFNVPSQQEALIGLMQFSMGLAEMESGVSEITGGLQSPQAVDTGGATGLAIANQNALTPLLYKQENLVDNITTKCIRWMYDWNMQFNPRTDIKCDVEVDVRTPILQIAAQSEKLDLERLSMEAGQNPAVEEKVDMGKLTDLRLAAMHVPYESVVRTPEEQEAYRQQKAQNQQPDPAMLKAQADLKNAETAARKVEVEYERLQYEREEGARRADMEMREAAMKDQTRQEESLARLLVAKTQENIALIENATKRGIEAEKMLAQQNKDFLDREVQLFIAGQQAQLKAGDLEIKRDEVALKKSGKTGI